MKAPIERKTGWMAAILFGLVAAGCGEQVGYCFFPGTEGEGQEMTQSDCEDANGDWQPLEQRITGV